MTLRWAQRLWPNAWFETLDMERPVSLAAVHANPSLDGTDEFFVYHDEHAASEWTEFGATEAGKNQMLHFIIKPHFSQGTEHHVEVSVIVDELTSDLQQTLFGLKKELLETASRARSPEEV